MAMVDCNFRVMHRVRHLATAQTRMHEKSHEVTSGE